MDKLEDFFSYGENNDPGNFIVMLKMLLTSYRVHLFVLQSFIPLQFYPSPPSFPFSFRKIANIFNFP